MYELVATKGGTKLMAGTAETNPNVVKGIDGKPQGGSFLRFYQREERTVAQAYTMQSLADFLSEPMQGLGRPVLDKTGLSGTYNFQLHWAPQGRVDEAASIEGETSLIEALNEVGLKLVPAKGMVEVVVIDHVERPSEN